MAPRMAVGMEDGCILVRYRSEAWARKCWRGWKRRALRSGLEQLKVFVRRLEPYLPGILAHCR